MAPGKDVPQGRKAQVQEQVDCMEAAIMDLDKSLAELAARLNAVLRTDCAKLAPDKGMDKEEALVPLAEVLRNQWRKIRKLTEGMNDLTCRAEV